MSDSTQAQRTFKPLVKLTGLYENVSQKTGETYYTGFLGSAKVVILKDKQAEPGKTTWNLCVQEKETKPDARQGYKPAQNAVQQGSHAQGRQTHPQQQGWSQNAAYGQSGYKNDDNLPF